MPVRVRNAVFAFLVTSAAVALAGPDDAPPVQSLAVGDFDGDGKPDVAVGLPEVNAGKIKKAGAVRFFSGATGALLHQLSGTSEEQGFGESIAAVGDVDGDGATDLAIAAPYGDPGSYIDFVSGKTGKRIFACSGGRSIAWADELCPLGDGSGTKRVDLAIRWVEGREWRYVYSDKEAVGCTVDDAGGFASSASSVGDFNGDREPDFAIANWTETVDGKKNAGAIRVFSGHHLSQGTGEAQLLVLRGTRAGESLGLAVAAVGDWNGDGTADLLAGVPGDSAKKDSSWLVRVFSGKDGAELWRGAGAPGDVSMGGVALVGDVDGDGKPDVAVGTPGAGSKAGAVTLLAAKDATVVWSVKGAARENLGEAVHPSADVDADGTADLVVVSPGAAVGGKKGNGYVRFLSGKTGALIRLVNPLATK